LVHESPFWWPHLDRDQILATAMAVALTSDLGPPVTSAWEILPPAGLTPSAQAALILAWALAQTSYI